MALMTSTEVKAFLRITATTYDTLIATYIPIIEHDICEYCNNWFKDRFVYRYEGGGIAFVRGNTATSSSSPDTITDDNQDFSTAGFLAGMDIVVEGGSANEGIYTLKTVSSGTLTLTCTGELVNQDQDSSYNPVGPVRISRIKWPHALKPIAAKMIWSQISDNQPSNMQSESIDDYSVTWINGHAYPARLLAGLAKYRYVVTG